MSTPQEEANPLPATLVTSSQGKGRVIKEERRSQSDGVEEKGHEAGQTDETLFLSACAGDVESLGVLIRRHESRLYSLLMRMGGDRNLADDLFQDTFLRAVRAAETFDASKKFKPWITAIAVNLFRDEVRKRKIRGEVSLGGEDKEAGGQTQDSDAPEARAEKEDEASVVKRALIHLTEKEKSVVLLHFYDGMTLLETSETLEIPIGTVKSRLHSGLTRLKQVLEQRER